MEDPVEIQFPGSDRRSIVLCMEEPRDRIPPTPFDHLSLYFRNGPAIENTISGGKIGKRIGGSTHVVNWFIASPTD